MARSNQNETIENTENETLDAAGAWAKAAASRKYGIHNGTPYVGAEGHVVPLPAPDWFDMVPAASRGTVFQALAEYVGNRVAQPLAKAENKSHDDVIRAAASALTNGFEPAQMREKDPVEAEVDRQFAALVREQVMAQKPDATPEQVADFTDRIAKTEKGIARRDTIRAAILDSGTYNVQRKKRKGAASADLGLELDI